VFGLLNLLSLLNNPARPLALPAAYCKEQVHTTAVLLGLLLPPSVSRVVGVQYESRMERGVTVKASVLIA